MAILHKDIQIPLASGHPLPSNRYNESDYYYAARIYYDSSWSNEERGRTLVPYFHGSGASDYLTGPLLDGLIAMGYPVVAVMNFGSGASPASPFRYGYGNVYSPHFYSMFIKHSWWVRSAVDYLAGAYQNANIVLAGHSMGASASLSYTSSQVMPSPVSPRVIGVFSSGATVGGLGNGSWNDVMRNIATLSKIINGLRVRTIVAAGDADAFGPPDYQRRIQLGWREGSEVYFLSPGNYGHGWTNELVPSSFAVNWIDQLARGAQVLTRLGVPASVGAFR